MLSLIDIYIRAHFIVGQLKILDASSEAAVARLNFSQTFIYGRCEVV